METREQRALHRHAAKADLARVRRQLERNPSLAATVDPTDMRTALHRVARDTSMPTSRQAIAAMLLAAAPQIVSAVDARGCTALHYAAAYGSVELVRQLMAAAPAAITLADVRGNLPLHFAAARTGGAATVAALLAAAPWTAMATTTNWNLTPLFEAAGADEESALLLLAADPAAVTVRAALSFRVGWTALTQAARSGHARLVAAILEVAPHAALIGDGNNDLPLHWASQHGFKPGHAVVRRLLIAAAPETCFMRDRDGDTPLMCAALQGNAGAIEQLLAAAPAAMAIANNQGKLPILAAVHRYARQPDTQTLESARHLLGAGDAAEVAAALRRAADDWDTFEGPTAAVQQLMVEFVALRALTAEQWAMLPADLPGLEAALPTVLARSEAEAAILMARLPAEKRAFLRAAMLSLARLQRITQLSIPAPALQHIVSLAVQPDEH